jgi:ABC-type multidrug transport system fused ATPase/permease subunit
MGKTKINLKSSIDFDKVRFRYPTAPITQPDTLQGVTFKIKAGTSTAIVGPSGSGKSTIVQMIERFYDPSSGTISLDGAKLTDFDLSQLRMSIGYVSQEPTLILGSIRENMLFSNKDATEDDIIRALQKANAGFVQELEGGLDAYVGSTTVQNLSGGQKQRLAIARALIKEPSILILDEATSALDPKSEQDVQQAIEKIQQSENLTIIMIAHRLQTIATAQNLLFINSPKEILAAERGTKEYDRTFNLLKSQNYKHQAIEDDIIEDSMFDQSNPDFEIPEERLDDLLDASMAVKHAVGTGILDLGATLPGPADAENLDVV